VATYYFIANHARPLKIALCEKMKKYFIVIPVVILLSFSFLGFKFRGQIAFTYLSYKAAKNNASLKIIPETKQFIDIGEPNVNIFSFHNYSFSLPWPEPIK
jgi:hypothetical protein